jgi:hypothetical protein
MRKAAAALAVLSVMLASASTARGAYSPASTGGWVITSGRVAGFAGGLFRTDVWLFNPDDTAFATVTLVFHPQVQAGQPAPAEIRSAPISLAPRETRVLPDATLSTVPAGDGAVGALEWEASLPVLVSARIYTAAPAGSFGYFLPGIPTSESLPAKQSPQDSTNILQIYGTNSGDTNFRTNLDIVNTSPVSVVVEVRVIDPVNATIYGGTQSYSVAPQSLLRLLNVLGAPAVPAVAGLRITVAVAAGTSLPSGGVLAVATTLDNRTNDAFAFVGQRQIGTVVPAGALSLSTLP